MLIIISQSAQTNSPKHKDSSFRIINDEEREKILTFEKLIREMFDIFASNTTEIIN